MKITNVNPLYMKSMKIYKEISQAQSKEHFALERFAPFARYEWEEM